MFISISLDHHNRGALDQRTGAPVVGVVRRETHLIDLEPVGARADGSDSIVNLGHVDVDRAVVVSLDSFGSAVRHHKKVFNLHR